MEMDVKTEKLRLIAWLSNLEDSSIIEELKSFKKKRELDWWDQLSEEQKEDIDAGIEDLDRGRKISFDSVMEKYGQ